MNHLEKLITELCPNGVKHVKLSEIAEMARGVRVVRSQLSDSGEYPVYQNSMTPLGYYEETNCPANTPFIISAGAAGEIGFCDVDFWAADDCFYFVCPESLNSKFLFYALMCQQKLLVSRVRRASVPRLARTVVEQLRIPLPPLAVQREIVGILDKLTECTAELAAKLTVELTARKKQYEYYRNVLLKFDENRETFATDRQADWLPLGEIGRVAMCKRIMKAETSSDGDVPFYKIGTFGKTADAFISAETYEWYRRDYSYPKRGDVLISAAGTIGRAVIFDGEPAYYQDSNIVWLEHDESKVLNKYLYYCYQLSPWHVSTSGTIARLYNANITKAGIPVPPLDEQERIVGILDKLDALTTNLTQGVPVEIAARKRQYEYYRDKLLTFKECA
ncbi:MAG: restriction endonuclease subunit S [Christensenellaceae bacterium]|jgi:type I restriction enzyme S subunit|nr:restriction endonuclease subunit S [Christensenellaceae bacterium]